METATVIGLIWLYIPDPCLVGKYSHEVDRKFRASCQVLARILLLARTWQEALHVERALRSTCM